MSFKDVLKESCSSLHLRSSSKEGIIAEMVDLMVEAGKIKDRKVALQAVLDREAKMSTGMQHGVAIPHGKTAAVDGLVTALALKPEGADFGSLDGKPSRIFVMTVSTINRTGPHIQYLSEISKALSVSQVRTRLLKAQTREEVIEILTS